MENKNNLELKAKALIDKIIKDFEKLDKQFNSRTNCICLIRQNNDDSWNTSININPNR